MPKTYTVKEVADILGYSTNSIYTFLKEKRIKGVRLGRGRFRISEEELVRVLHLSKKSLSVPAGLSNPSHIPSVQTKEDGTPLVNPRDVLCPNLFDWFAGLAAVIAGVGLFLFNSSVVRPEVTGFSHIVFAIRLILIAAGGGVLASAVVVQTRGWHKVFHGLLGTLGLINGWILLRGDDVDGAILYGIMGLVLWIGLGIHTRGILLLGIYLTILAILFPVWLVGFATTPKIAAVVSTMGISPAWFDATITILSLAYLVLFWIGHRGNRVLLTVSSVLVALGCFGGALWYGLVQYWSRAFFLITLGFFAGIMPYWQALCDVAPRRQRLLFHGLFAVGGGVLVCAVFVVYLLQRNLWATSTSEFFNRISTAQNVLTSAVEAAQSAAVMTAANGDVTAALTKKDVAPLIAASKLLYESNSTIRRVVFLSASGEGVSLYPYGTFDLSNYAFREYFIKARDTKAPYISNIFQAAVDHAGRYVTVVAVPVLNAKGEFAGVLAVSMDLDRLGLKLRQLAVESRGEYFIIVDQNKKILSHPDSKRIGMQLPEDDLIYTVDVDKKGVAGGVLPNGVVGLIAYGPVEQLGWIVTLRMPLTQVYALSSHAAIWVFGTVAVVLTATLWFVSLLKVRGLRQSGGGP